MDILRDSVETSMMLGLFKTRDESYYAHKFKSSLIEIKMERFKNMINFGSERRLKSSAEEAYSDSPRGPADIASVKYHQSQPSVPPIWVIRTGDDDLTLLDGAHRIVACFIKGDKTIPAYFIN